MTVSGLPQPLPECLGCGAPLPRAVWRTRRRCSGCASTPELLAAVHTRADLERVAAVADRKAQERIERLAVKRATRQRA